MWGVASSEAEAELIAASVACFRSLGLTGGDVGIKVCMYVCLHACM